MAKKAWPRNVSTAIWLYNNAVVCRCLTQGQARIPFKSQVQFPLKCVLFSSNSRCMSTLLQGPIKSIDCFALWLINKVQRKIGGEYFFFHKSSIKSNLFGTCWLRIVINKVPNKLGNSWLVNTESFSFTKHPHISPCDFWTYSLRGNMCFTTF